MPITAAKLSDSEHAVQFYESDEFLVGTVSRFVSSALAGGDGVLVCLTDDHRHLIEIDLAAQGIELHSACERGQYVALTASDILAQVIVDGLPSPERFRDVVGGAVAKLAKSWPQVKAFGELVTVLCEEGNREAASRLEELWHGLLGMFPIALLCAYRIQNLSVDCGGVSVAQICNFHSRVIPAESFTGLSTLDEQLRTVVALQQKSNALEVEIAKRKRTERELTDFVENSLEGLHKVGPDGRIIWANNAELNLLGYSRDEYIGRHIADYHVDQPVIEDILKKLTSGESIYNYAARLRCKDGSIKNVLIHSNGYFENGQLVYTRCYSRDVTDNTQAEGERALLAAIVASSEDAIVSKKLDGTLTSWNQAAERLFGFSADEMIGESIEVLIPEDRLHEEAEIIHKIRHGEQIRHYQTQRKRKDGTLVDVSLAISPVVDSSGRIIGASKIARDITEQVQTLKDLERASQAAEKAIRSKAAFLANVSHELRTPMTAVLGFAEILRMESSDPEYVDKVDSITRNGKYLLALLDDVLDLSKIDAGKHVIESQLVDVHKAIDDVRSLMEVRADAEGVPLRIEWKSKVPKRITADRVRVRQVLVNLIGNALKFTDEGEVLVSIKLAGRYLNFEVADTGIGMSPEQLERIFRPFTQATRETAQQFGGTGLGLTISKRLASAMGGKIHVESEVGVGSRFTLSLPVTDDQLKNLAGPAKTRIVRKSRHDETPPKISARILLADDRRDVWRVGKYFLELCGAEVVIAEDGRQAVDAVIQASERGKPFSLIIMDMQMPVMNGRDAVSELRAKGFDMPIIALTADAMAGDRESCLEIGCSEYVAKPIDGAKLIDLVASLLD